MQRSISLFFNKLVLVSYLLLCTMCSWALETDEIADWTFIVYMAADNDLRGFGIKNIKQMAQVGSNERINIVVHLDIKLPGNKKITRRYLVKKDELVQEDTENTQVAMDSGDPETVISCCRWAITEHPARNFAFVPWDHGSGPVDLDRGKIHNPIELFAFNPDTRKLEIDRSIGYFEFLEQQRDRWWLNRGVCWDDSTGNYLTNQKFDYALHTVRSRYLNGEKFALIIFDACLMASLEIGNICKNHADYMIASQEVELGAGLEYKKVLSPFIHQSLSPADFARHIVRTYDEVYSRITDDYTYSALDLNQIDLLEDNVHSVAELLIFALKHQRGNSVSSLIATAISKRACTHFSEPSYIDLHHLYKNLLANLHRLTLSTSDEISLRIELEKKLLQGLELFDRVVIANVVGKNLSKAKGISIYFPEMSIHSSYPRTTFATDGNAWITLLRSYLHRA